MKKLFGFLTGFLILLITFAIVYLSAAIYDTQSSQTVEPYFFRPWTRPNIAKPKTLDEVGEKALRNMLVQKYVKEYFYEIPSNDDLVVRTSYSGFLNLMSTDKVFDDWKKNIVPELSAMVQNGYMRMVTVSDEIFKPANSDYWQVDYELKTWEEPNNLSATPKITYGTVYLDIVYAGLHEPIEKVQKKLLNGEDPATMFIFEVQDIIVRDKQ